MLACMLIAAGALAVAAPSTSSTRPRRDAGPTPRAAVTQTEGSPGPHADYLIGTVTSKRITARAAPNETSEVIATFGRVNPQGAPQVFLLDPEEVDDGGLIPPGTTWVRALLPVRPNGTTGYLPLEDLTITTTSYRIVVDRASFELTVWEGNEVLMEVPVGIGRGETPTPVGRFYLASLLRPPDTDTIYGTWAYGLSGYSETLTEWEDGGVIGLHGTNDPSSVGHPISHGCIRMRNRDIESLVPILPLGTPIRIY